MKTSQRSTRKTCIQNKTARQPGKDRRGKQCEEAIAILHRHGRIQRKRQAYSITRYTHVILLDIDDQPEEKLEDLREKINKDPNTLGSFLTPKAHGFKIFVFLQTEDATTLRETFSNGEKDFAALEKYHRMMYDTCKEYYEKLLDVEVDGSGKDISRGFFTSFDEKAYLNEELMKEVDEILTGIVPPENRRRGERRVGKR